MSSDFSVILNNISDVFGYSSEVGKYRVSGIESDGIDGFTFSVAKDHEINLSSSITDYPIEDGNVAQNVITLNPEKVKLSGIVGEVIYGKGLVTQLVDSVASSLLPIAVLSPSLCSLTIQIKNQLDSQLGELAYIQQQVKGIIGAVSGYASLLGVSDAVGLSMTIQEKAYYYLEKCWKSRKLLQIETPWRYFEDMVIEDLKFTQSEVSTSYSDVEVTFKRIVSPKTRDNERTTLKEGRAQTGLPNTFRTAGSAGLKVISPIYSSETTSSVVYELVGTSSSSVTEIMNQRARTE